MKNLVLLLTFIVAFASISYGQAHTASIPALLSIKITGPSQLRVGQNFEIRVKFTNSSDHELTFSTFYVEGVDLTLHYDIRDSEGHLQQRKERKRDGSIKSITLKSGDSEEESTLLSQIFDFPAGEYTIWLARDIPGDTTGNTAKSNKINVTVVP